MQIAEEIMLVLSQDKRTLFAELENLSAKSFKGLKELEKLKTYSPITYLSSMNLKQTAKPSLVQLAQLSRPLKTAIKALNSPKKSMNQSKKC